MRTTVLVLLLWAGITAPAIAGELNDRFQVDFGEDAAVPPAENGKPAAMAVPTPRFRPARTDAHVPSPSRDEPPPSAPDRTLHVPATGLPAIQSPKGAQNQYDAGISWNPLDTAWDGMFLSNRGEKPFAVLGIALNGRRDCSLQSYSLGELRRYIELPEAIRVWGQNAINLFGLPNMKPDSVLVPDLPPRLQTNSVHPQSPTLKAGERIPIFNGTKCDTVSGVTVETDRGSVSMRLQRPYRGH